MTVENMSDRIAQSVKSSIKSELDKIGESVKQAIRDELDQYGTGETHDQTIYEYLLISGVSGIGEKMPSEFKSMPKDAQESIISALMKELNPGDGIKFSDDQKVPFWVQVTPLHEKYRPRNDPSQQRWIRLDTITQVIPKALSYTEGQPQSETIWGLAVEANGEKYYVSSKEFKGEAIREPEMKLLSAVTKAVAVSNSGAAIGLF
ncbi:hypothetical protein ACK56M_14680 [Pseudomonas sp. s4]|uniref:hypothetical protein n=1 Tax=Pseudomonas sp. s4 TaxID=353218 RepID=UPI00398CF956